VVTEGAVKSTKYSTADKVYVNPTIKWSFKTESANVYYLETYMATQFPTWENGENGVYLQYKDKQNNYTDLKYSEKYEAFVSDGKNSLSGVSIPAVASLNANTPKIVAIPYVDPTGINPKDAIMRVRLDGNYGNVKISGEAAPITGKLRYYIYLGRNNYNKPVWQSTTGGKFELTVAYKDGDELFFAVGSTSGSSKNTGIPGLSNSGGSVFNGAGLPAWIGLRLQELLLNAIR
jgi:hypothetical protein